MATTNRIAAGSLLAVLLSGTMLQAQVTAPQVWDDWQATLQAGGATELTVGSEDYAGGTLTLSDIAFTMTEDDATIAVTLPRLVLTENSDGSVAITMAETAPIRVTSEDEDGAPTALSLTAEQPGAAITATGTPGALDYAIDFPLFALNLDSLDVEGRDYVATGRFAVTAVTGTYGSVTKDGMIDVAYDIAGAGSEFTFDLTETDTTAKPARTISFSAAGQMDAPQSQATMTVPENAADLDEAEALAAGFTFTGNQSAGAGEITFRADDNGSVTEGSLTMAGATATAGAGGSDVSYDMALNDLSVALAGGDLPFPVNFTSSGIALDVAMPMLPSDEASPFKFVLDLADLALNEEVWAMFDPQKTIPRDPATLRLDLSGLAHIQDEDTAAPAAPAPTKPGMTAPAGDAEAMGLPAILHSLDINDLTLAFGGARIGATGALTFDPADWLADAMPMPVGEIDLSLKGINALTQKLQALGLIPAEQVMMGMMFLGMYTVPTGDDEMGATIGFTADGGITANGQPVF